MLITGNNPAIKTTSYRVVLPFYFYAALSFLAGTVLLFDSIPVFSGHYFHPKLLAVTHCMALGWGTMMIMGAAHQLVPVLIEGKLYSDLAAYLSFALAALGIPLLVYGFYTFSLGMAAQWGGILIVAAIVVCLFNLAMSMARSKSENVHAVFVFTATLWLLSTTCLGLALLFNFTTLFMLKDSLSYLSLHAHMGIVGWFLLMIIGVGTKLIPMFLISKYSNNKILWLIFILINLGLLSFVFLNLYTSNQLLLLFPLLLTGISLALFVSYCFNSYKHRIRKKVDEQMKLSLLSVLLLLIPLLLLLLIVGLMLLFDKQQNSLVLAYGFLLFFGWISSIILGMSFKTLPFIVWNKVYHKLVGTGITPNPKDLFSRRLFRMMGYCYVPGILIFTSGIVLEQSLVMQGGAVCLFVSAVFYTWNILKIINHKAVKA